MTTQNRLFYGDCLDVLRTLESESVDLVYLDPPFNSKKDYNAFFSTEEHKDADAQITAFEDTWHWGEQAQKEYNDLLQNPEAGSLGETLLPALRQFLAESDMMAYLVMMGSRLVELRRILKNTGSLYLHCDPTASHYLKIILDGIFGAVGYKSEIIWKRTSSHNRAKRWGPIHDTILFYTKSSNFTWNKILMKLDEKYVEDYYKHEDEHGLFQTVDLTGPGQRKGDCGLEWNGINPTDKKRHWEVPPDHALPEWFIFPEGYSQLSVRERLDILDQQGIIIWPKKQNGVPRYKRYIQENSGTPVQDIITDIGPLSAKSAEKLGYPTQKPVELLERIINASTNEGDIILDPFCGCGTAIHAAEKLKRKWIGIDITHLAIGLIRQRLKKAFPNCKFSEEGTPKDVASARHLAESSGLDGRYQFQYWALFLAGALPAQGKKKGADSGIDGYIWFYDHYDPKAKPKKIVVSVKSGKIPANHIRELAGMLKDPVEIAVLLTLEEPSRVMKADAIAAGNFKYPNGHEVPKIQILTVKDLLDGKRPNFLDHGEGRAMNKQAKREKEESSQGNLL